MCADVVAWVAKETVERKVKQVGSKLGLSDKPAPRKRDHEQKRIDRVRERQDRKISEQREARMAATERRREELRKKYLTPRDGEGIAHQEEQTPGCFSRYFCCCCEPSHVRLPDDPEQEGQDDDHGESEGPPEAVATDQKK